MNYKAGGMMPVTSMLPPPAALTNTIYAVNLLTWNAWIGHPAYFIAASIITPACWHQLKKNEEARTHYHTCPTAGLLLSTHSNTA